MLRPPQLENDHLRHTYFYMCGSCLIPSNSQAEAKLNSPSRIPIAEPRCGWWLLIWLDSSTVFSMTEPASSARSNSFRKFFQVASRLVIWNESVVGYEPDELTGCWRRDRTQETCLRSLWQPINKERRRTVSKLSHNSWLLLSDEEPQDTHNPTLCSGAAPTRPLLPVMRLHLSSADVYLLIPKLRNLHFQISLPL